MNVADFTYLLKKPEKITEDNIASVQKIVEEYPFFQPAKAVYLKALKDQDSFKYNNALKNTAAYTTDRSILFELITSKIFYQDKIAENITKLISEIYDIEVEAEEVTTESVEKENETSTVDSQKIKLEVTEQKIVEIEKPVIKELEKTSFDFDNVDSEAVMDPDLFQLKPTISNYSFLDFKHRKVEQPNVQDEIVPTKPTIDKTPEEKLEIGKPLEFDNTEKHSFTEWLKLSTVKPIDREENIENKDREVKNSVEEEIPQTENSKLTVNSTEEKFKLIDKFIENNPKISPPVNELPKQNLAKGKNVEKSELMTETLARVYLEQKKYKKAIQAYRILSLKYPEKSGFFADQINAVKKLQQNN